MESWLKARAAEVAKKAADAAEHASKIGNELADQACVLLSEEELGRKDLEFMAGPLGFKLEGVAVTVVEERGQAARLGVAEGDILHSVAGYEVPDIEQTENGDSEEEQHRDRLIKKWIKEAPRPVRLSFISLFAHIDVSHELSARAVDGALEPELSAELMWQDMADLAGADDPLLEDRVQSAEAEVDEHLAALLVAAGASSERAESGPCEGGALADADPMALTTLPLGELGSLRAELRREQAQRIALSTELVKARQGRSQISADLEAERRQNVDAQAKVIDLQQRLTALSEECSEFRRAAMQSGEDVNISRETSEARERVLEDEVARLRSELVASEGKARTAAEAVKQKVIELEVTVGEQASEAHRLVARAVEAENKAETAEYDLRRLRESHAAEDLEARELHERELGKLHDQLTEAGERFHEAEEALTEARRQASQQCEAMDAPLAEPSGAAEKTEQDTGKPVQGIDLDDCPEPSDQAKESLEAEAKHERLAFLEERCRTLQQQLNSRPIVFQKPDKPGKLESGGFAGGQALSWEPQLRSTCGPHTAAFAVRLFTAADGALRRFTQRLLKNDAWLWVFYVHLLVLYTIAGSSYAKVSGAASEHPSVSLVAPAPSGGPPG